MRLSTYKTQLSTQYNPVNCTFATEKGFRILNNLFIVNKQPKGVKL